MERRVESARLLEAIDSADASILQEILKSMCESSEECRREAMKRLLLRVPSAPSKRKLNDGDQLHTSDKKQKTEEENNTVIPRYEECITCKKVFDVAGNSKSSCRTHPDGLELNEGYFVDDDEIDSGAYIDPETDWRRQEFPDGFIWSCCEKNADGEGCLVQRHIPRSIASRNAIVNLVTSDEESDEESTEGSESEFDEED